MGVQCIYGSMKGADSVLQLLDQILLVATLVCIEHHLLRRHLGVVGDVEEVFHVIEEDVLSSFHREVLSQDDEAIFALAPAWSVDSPVSEKSVSV